MHRLNSCFDIHVDPSLYKDKWSFGSLFFNAMKAADESDLYSGFSSYWEYYNGD